MHEVPMITSRKTDPTAPAWSRGHDTGYQLAMREVTAAIKEELADIVRAASEPDSTLTLNHLGAISGMLLSLQRRIAVLSQKSIFD